MDTEYNHRRTWAFTTRQKRLNISIIHLRLRINVIFTGEILNTIIDAINEAFFHESGSNEKLLLFSSRKPICLTSVAQFDDVSIRNNNIANDQDSISYFVYNSSIQENNSHIDVSDEAVTRFNCDYSVDSENELPSSGIEAQNEIRGDYPNIKS
jgi:hypothetical protein